MAHIISLSSVIMFTPCQHDNAWQVHCYIIVTLLHCSLSQVSPKGPIRVPEGYNRVKLHWHRNPGNLQECQNVPQTCPKGLIRSPKVQTGQTALASRSWKSARMPECATNRSKRSYKGHRRHWNPGSLR